MFRVEHGILNNTWSSLGEVSDDRLRLKHSADNPMQINSRKDKTPNDEIRYILQSMKWQS